MVNIKQFIITRHAYSCNNINKTLIRKLKFSEYDPSITIHGLINTYLQGLKETSKVFNSNKVLVSILIRTWITATLLYIHKQLELTLIISPYLKEKHLKIAKSLDTSNIPLSFKLQLIKYYKFLYYMIDIINVTQMKNNFINKTINIIFESYKVVFYINNKDNNEKILITVFKKISNDEYKEIHFINKSKVKSSLLNNTLEPDYITYLKNLDITQTTKTYKKELIKPYSQDYTIDITNSRKDLLFYKKNENIAKFINWVYNNISDKKIHCVSHSKIMQQFYKLIMNSNTDIETKQQNSWSMVFNTNLNNNKISINSVKIKHGIISTYNYTLKKDMSIKSCEILCFHNSKIIHKKNCSKRIKLKSNKFLKQKTKTKKLK